MYLSPQYMEGAKKNRIRKGKKAVRKTLDDAQIAKEAETTTITPFKLGSIGLASVGLKFPIIALGVDLAKNLDSSIFGKI